jgi:hypothetical protein
MSAIRDDGFTSEQTTYFEDADKFVDYVVGWAKTCVLIARKGRSVASFCGARPPAWCPNSPASPTRSVSRSARPVALIV